MRSRFVAKSRIFKIYEKQIKFANGKKSFFEYCSLFDDTKDSVMAIPLTDDRKLVFIEQEWPGMGKRGLIFPGGRIDKGENEADAVVRELIEEIKFCPQKIKKIATLDIFPKYFYGQTHIFLATNLRPNKDREGDEAEDLKIHVISLEAVLDKVHSGKITDSRTVAAIMLVKDELVN